MISLRRSIFAAFAVAFASAGLQPSAAQTPAPEKPSLKVAIMSGKGLETEADLLAADLSRDLPTMTLLERTDLTAVTSEGALTAGKLPATLESADLLILIELVSAHETPYLATRIVRRDDGTLRFSDLRAKNQTDRQWTREMTGKLRDFALIKRSGPSPDLSTVSVRVVREEFTAGEKENELLSVAITRMLNAELSKLKQLRVLERVDLSLIQFERFLTRIDTSSFEEADRTISGTFRSSEGSTQFEIRMETPGTSEEKKAGGSIPTEKPGDIAAAMSAEIQALLAGAGVPSGKPNPRASSGNLFALDESGRFASEADRALRLGLHENAATFAATAQLLDSTDEFRTLHLLACTELLASLPSLRGRGIKLEPEITVENQDSEGAARLVFEDLFPLDENGAPLPPQPEQWPPLATAAERVVDLSRIASNLEGGRRSIALTKLTSFAGIVSKLSKELILNALGTFGAEVPPFERDHLGRIVAASRALHLAAKENTEKPAANDWPLLFRELEALVLETSPDDAVSRIRDTLYGEEVTSLKGEMKPGGEMTWYRIDTKRSQLFDYFEYLGYDENTDSSSALIDERIFKKPFVAWLSNSPMKFEDAFAAALAGVEGEQKILAGIDAQFQAAGTAHTHETRAIEFSKLRTLILENLDTLKSLGLLEIYTYHLAQWEMSREPRANDDRAAFWKTVHSRIYSDNGWSPGRLTDHLADHFDGGIWSTEHTESPAQNREFLNALQRDVTSNTNPLGESGRRYSLTAITKALTKLSDRENAVSELRLSDVRAVEGLPGIPEAETIVLKAASFGYGTTPVATEVTEEGIFSFRHGNFDRGWPSRILTYDLAGTIDEILLPDEILELVNDAVTPETLGRLKHPADIRVSGERIDLAFPGGMASYDRTSQEWKVTPIPFLTGRHGVRMNGDKIFSYTGKILSLPDVPVHGIYVTDTATMEHLALADTSRQPAVWLLDRSKTLEFSFPPLFFAQDRLIFGMRGIAADQEIFYYKRDWKMDEPTKRPHPIPFTPGRGAQINASEANGYALVAATRRTPVKTEKPEAKESKMTVGAFAIDEQGKTHWLLDSGVTPAIGPIPAGAGSESDRKMMLPSLNAHPVFTFPEEFSAHRGQYCSDPVIHYNGTRLLLLTGQTTDDGRRLLYLWRNHEEKTPQRFALRLESFFWVEDFTEEERFDWNRKARDTILSIFEWRDRIVFEFSSGFMHMTLEEFEKYLKE